MRDEAVINAVLSLRDAASGPEGVYHLRVYEPEESRVVVLGALTDSAGPDLRATLNQLIEVVRRDHPSLNAERVSWFLYYPYGYVPGEPDRFVPVHLGANGEAESDTSGSVASTEVDQRAGTAVMRYLASDYTSFGVRPSRRAVASWAELNERRTRNCQPAIALSEVRAIVADMGIALSQMRDVASWLAEDISRVQGPEALTGALVGQLQVTLAAGVDLTSRAIEGSVALEGLHPGEPTLATACVFDADLPSLGGPPLGSCHVRVYRPPQSPALIIIGQLKAANAVSVLAAAPTLIPRIRQRLLPDETTDPIWLAYYPEGSLHEGSSGFFFLNRQDEFGQFQPASYEQVTALAGGPVRRYTTAQATVDRLP